MLCFYYFFLCMYAYNCMNECALLLYCKFANMIALMLANATHFIPHEIRCVCYFVYIYLSVLTINVHLNRANCKIYTKKYKSTIYTQSVCVCVGNKGIEKCEQVLGAHLFRTENLSMCKSSLCRISEKLEREIAFGRNRVLEKIVHNRRCVCVCVFELQSAKVIHEDRIYTNAGI